MNREKGFEGEGTLINVICVTKFGFAKIILSEKKVVASPKTYLC